MTERYLLGWQKMNTGEESMQYCIERALDRQR